MSQEIRLKNQYEQFYDLKNQKILTENEEKILAKKLYYQNDILSAKKLILSHLKFVIKIAKSYSGYGLQQSDLVQEGSIGLMKAVRRFNPEIGVRLVSFAIHWIKAEIHSYILKNWKIVKVATTKAQKKLFFNLRKIKSYQHVYWLTLEETEIIASELGVKHHEVKEMEQRMITHNINTNLAEKEDGDANLIKITDITSNFAKNFHTQEWKKYALVKLQEAIAALDYRSKNIITKRWLAKKNKMKLSELAEEYDISTERVRQIELNALKKLRSSMPKECFLQNKF